MDLVRAPEHPDREGDYIIEDCSESYKAWKVMESGRGKLSWEWNLRTIRRIHYHKNVEKLEIEAGRYVSWVHLLHTSLTLGKSWDKRGCSVSDKFQNLHLSDNGKCFPDNRD